MKHCDICGSESRGMNLTNWNRHIKSCKSKIPTKKNSANNSIKHFFTKKIKLENIGKSIIFICDEFIFH